MKNQSLEQLEGRITELERMVWAMFRVFETYITFREPPDGRSQSEEE